MRKHLFLRALSVFGAFVLVGSLASTALAQQVPVRVVQGTDGTLYVLQGSNSWTLVPGQMSDSDVSALNPGGEIDEVLPNDLFVQAPAASPAAAPNPPSAPAATAPTPPPAPAATAPITGSADLTGKAGSDLLSATAIGVGASITSIVDTNTKPFDVYAIALSGGRQYSILSKTSNKYGGAGIAAIILNPNGSVANGNFTLGGYYIPGCFGPGGADTCNFAVAVDGTYYVKMQAGASGQNYTFTVK